MPMTEQADEEFREFMASRWPGMVRLAYGLTGDHGHAEDLAQTAFAKAYASWARVSRTGNPDAYLRQIVLNENRNRFRKRRVTERLTGQLPEPELDRQDSGPATTSGWRCWPRCARWVRGSARSSCCGTGPA
jgi:DNA-directed RNA polymerase specialized sigma24 family protein